MPPAKKDELEGMKYLLLVMKHSEFKPNYHEVAKEAGVISANGAQKRFKKFVEQGGFALVGGNVVSPEGTPPTTPSKRGAKKAAAATTTSSATKKRKMEESREEEEGEEEEGDEEEEEEAAGVKGEDGRAKQETEAEEDA